MYHHFATLFFIILSLFSSFSVLAQTTAATLSYDNTYDNANLSLNNVACSTGLYGLESKDYSTLGSLPTFPNVGGVDTITSYDSPECGTCYSVTFPNTGKTVNILGVDVSKTGFTVSQAAMDTLTGGLAVELGRISVDFVQVNASVCGL